jgi:serine/threonine-protein kinase
MKRERWRRVQELFLRAVDLAPDERERLLAAECGGDPELRSAVDRMVQNDAGVDPVLDGAGAVPASAAVDPLLGRIVDRYRLTEVLGVGGMGVVYAAERADGLFEQEVAVKVVRAALGAGDLARRFDQERRALAALSHPHIARLYDGGATDEGSPYLVMERVRGEPIDRWCDARRLPVERRLALFAEVARTVHFAHTNLVVHRDLKPSNVFVDDDGRPKLLDFGIAHLLDPEEEPDAARTHTQLMTPEFASPEQLSGGPVTTATDVYSLGVVLYVLLTGRRPYHFTSQSPAAWERLVAERTPTRPSTAIVRPGARPAHPDAPPPLHPDEVAARFGTTPRRLRRRLAGDLDRIVMMALRKEPERRYSSAQELAEDVERHLAGLPVRAREDTLGYRVARFVQRNRVAVLAGAAVALALVAGSVAAWRGERRARAEARVAAEQASIAQDERRRAEEEAQRAAEQAVHARIEADSFREIATFLEGHLLALLDATEGEGELLRTTVATIQRQAGQVRRQYADDRHLQANMIDALGRTAMAFGENALAASLIDEALELREEEFGAESLEVALSLASRGLLLYRSGDFAAAEPVLRRRLELHRALPVGTHTDVALAANDLAAVLRNLGKLDEAQALHEEALALRRERAPDSVLVAESLNNLAGIALGRGRWEEAAEMLTEALAIRRRILGEAHPLVVQSLSNLAGAAYRVGHAEQARRHLEDAERAARELGATGAEGLAYVLSTLGAMDLAAGELDLAERRLDEALELRRKLLPAGHPAIVAQLEKQADLHVARGDLAAADTVWNEVVAARRATLSPAHPELGRTLREHAVFLARAERYEEARAALVEAIGILDRAGAPDTAELGRAQVGLARMLGLLGRPAEGLEHARAGLELLRDAPGTIPGEVEQGQEVVSGLEEAAAGG